MTQPAPVPTPPPGDPAPTVPPTPAPAPVPVSAEPADAPLGPAGERALAAERVERKKLEQQLAALSPLTKLAEALGAGTPAAAGKSEVDLLNEKFATYESQLGEERQARWRAEIASSKGLTADQAAWISGTTAEEFAASADKLLASFPATPAGPRTPAPDPSQGARGGQPGPDLQAQVDEARKAGDFGKAISLERSKLQNIKRPT